MQLALTRTLESLKPTLMDSAAVSPSEVYWVFSQISAQQFTNLTIITPGKIGAEFNKTFGHYHTAQVPETYRVVSGEGVLLLQKKANDERRVNEVLLIRAHAGDEIVIPPEYGHSWSNIGGTPLILFDNWRSGHKPTDYEIIGHLHGMAYYLTGSAENIVPVANSNYLEVPVFRMIEAKNLKL